MKKLPRRRARIVNRESRECDKLFQKMQITEKITFNDQFTIDSRIQATDRMYMFLIRLYDKFLESCHCCWTSDKVTTSEMKKIFLCAYRRTSTLLKSYKEMQKRNVISFRIAQSATRTFLLYREIYINSLCDENYKAFILTNVALPSVVIKMIMLYSFDSIFLVQKKWQCFFVNKSSN